MARTKSHVVTAHQLPESVKTGDRTLTSNHSMKTASPSPSSSPASMKCPDCDSIFSGISSKDFRDHVASCTRPSTASTTTDDDDSSDSSLTPPPEPSLIVTLKYGKHPVKSDSVTSTSSIVNGTLAKNPDVSATIESDDVSDTKPILAYDTTTFDFYDKVDDREDSVMTRQNSEELENPKSSSNGKPDGSSEEKAETKRYPFQKFTSVEDFEDYVVNAEDSSYEDLYDRTSHIASTLVCYQKEWDDIEKEIYIYESYVKAQAKKAAEEAKVAEEEKMKVEDQIYLEIAEAHKPQLKLSRGEWEQYLESYDTSNVKENDLVERLRSLRLPNFLSAIHKRQKGREPEPVKLIDRPIMAERITKEELAMDKRKRGRLIDQITFDDMKHADTYGFNYSSQLHHVGNQPQPTYSGKVQARGDAYEEGRSRSQRNKHHKSYDAERSDSPESENDELPAKRSRKPRMNLDMGVESQGRRTGPGSRSDTPQVRTFPSGKRVGRPPAKSKLAAVLLPPLSASPTYEDVTSQRSFLRLQQDDLHNAAESLFNKTRRNGAQSTRDRESTSPTSGGPTRPPSVSSTGSTRKRKREAQFTNTFSMAPINPTVMATTAAYSAPILPPVPSVAFAGTPPLSSTGIKRKRKPKQPAIDESLLGPEEIEALRKKRAKSAKLSESLRKRWEKGEMAVAMKSRKATNDKKKRAKAEAKAAATGDLSAAPPMVPSIAPNLLYHVDAVHPHPIIPAPAPIDGPPAKRKYVFKKPKKQAPAPEPLQHIEFPYTPPPPATFSAEREKHSSKGKKRAPPSPLTTRPPSSRARRPARRASEIDGMDDEEEEDGEELEQQFRSEYDHYQALTSPGSPVLLGKRVRKQKVNLAAVMHDDDMLDDDSYSS